MSRFKLKKESGLADGAERSKPARRLDARAVSLDQDRIRTAGTGKDGHLETSRKQGLFDKRAKSVDHGRSDDEGRKLRSAFIKQQRMTVEGTTTSQNNNDPEEPSRRRLDGEDMRMRRARTGQGRNTRVAGSQFRDDQHFHGDGGVRDSASGRDQGLKAMTYEDKHGDDPSQPVRRRVNSSPRLRRKRLPDCSDRPGTTSEPEHAQSMGQPASGDLSTSFQHARSSSPIAYTQNSVSRPTRAENGAGAVPRSRGRKRRVRYEERDYTDSGRPRKPRRKIERGDERKSVRQRIQDFMSFGSKTEEKRKEPSECPEPEFGNLMEEENAIIRAVLQRHLEEEEETLARWR